MESISPNFKAFFLSYISIPEYYVGRKTLRVALKSIHATSRTKTPALGLTQSTPVMKYPRRSFSQSLVFLEFLLSYSGQSMLCVALKPPRPTPKATHRPGN